MNIIEKKCKKKLKWIIIKRFKYKNKEMIFKRTNF